MKDKKSVALIGLGYWGKNLLRNLVELEVLSIACDVEKQKIDEFKQKYKNVNFTTSVDEILQNPDIKAIVVATPAATHYEITKKVLENDKDVFVEKPLALTIKEGEELVKLSKNKKRILMVGHILHYHPAVKKLKEILEKGVLGKIQYIYSNRLNIGKLRTEENILWSFAPHDVSVILSLVKSEPKKILSFGEDYLNKGVYDTTVTMLEFENKIKAHIFVSWLHPFKEQKLIVVGSNAMAVFDDLTEEKLFLYPHKIEWKNGQIPVAQKADAEIIPVEKKEPLKEELIHFLECVEKRTTPLTDGEEGLKVLKVLSAAEVSLKEEKFVSLASFQTIFDEKKYFVHESCYIDENVEIGEGTKIWHFTHILKNTKIGKNCIIGQNVCIGPDVKIGERCKIQNNVSIYKGVTLEDEVFCGPSCVFTNVYNPRAFIERKHEFKETLVKKGATIGANATIVCGVTIGSYAMVGAGAVVKKDVPDYAVVAGVPARQIGWACKCGTTLKFENNYAICNYCKSEYALENDNLKVIKEEI